MLTRRQAASKQAQHMQLFRHVSGKLTETTISLGIISRDSTHVKKHDDTAFVPASHSTVARRRLAELKNSSRRFQAVRNEFRTANFIPVSRRFHPAAVLIREFDKNASTRPAAFAPLTGLLHLARSGFY